MSTYTAQSVIDIATNEVGYLGKASATNLDDKTANSGGKYTKYARDIDSTGLLNGAKQGYDWCAMFVIWCHYQASNKSISDIQSIGYFGTGAAGVPYLKGYYQAKSKYDKSPKIGDTIIIDHQSDSSDGDHTGIVYKVDSTTVYTIEGNSNSSVRKCQYSLSDSTIIGYGHPNYSTESSSNSTSSTSSSASQYPSYSILDPFFKNKTTHNKDAKSFIYKYETPKIVTFSKAYTVKAYQNPDLKSKVKHTLNKKELNMASIYNFRTATYYTIENVQRPSTQMVFVVGLGWVEQSLIEFTDFTFKNKVTPKMALKVRSLPYTNAPQLIVDSKKITVKSGVPIDICEIMSYDGISLFGLLTTYKSKRNGWIPLVNTDYNNELARTAKLCLNGLISDYSTLNQYIYDNLGPKIDNLLLDSTYTYYNKLYHDGTYTADQCNKKLGKSTGYDYKTSLENYYNLNSKMAQVNNDIFELFSDSILPYANEVEATKNNNSTLFKAKCTAKVSATVRNIESSKGNKIGVVYKDEIVNVTYYGKTMSRITGWHDNSDGTISKKKGWIYTKFIQNLDNNTNAADGKSGSFTPYKVKITVDLLNVRKGPGINYEIVGGLTYNTEATITKVQTDQWGSSWGYAISNNSSVPSGWIYLAYTSANASDLGDSDSKGFTAYMVQITATDGLNVRTGPSTDYTIVDTLPYGTKVKISSEKINSYGDKWGYILDKGYIYLGYTSKVSSNSNINSATSINAGSDSSNDTGPGTEIVWKQGYQLTTNSILNKNLLKKLNEYYNKAECFNRIGLDVRDKPSSDKSNIIGKLYWGAVTTIVSYEYFYNNNSSNKYYYVKIKGWVNNSGKYVSDKEGWVQTDEGNESLKVINCLTPYYQSCDKKKLSVTEKFLADNLEEINNKIRYSSVWKHYYKLLDKLQNDYVNYLSDPNFDGDEAYDYCLTLLKNHVKGQKILFIDSPEKFIDSVLISYTSIISQLKTYLNKGYIDEKILSYVKWCTKYKTFSEELNSIISNLQNNSFIEYYYSSNSLDFNDFTELYELLEDDFETYYNLYNKNINNKDIAYSYLVENFYTLTKTLKITLTLLKKESKLILSDIHYDNTEIYTNILNKYNILLNGIYYWGKQEQKKYGLNIF